MADSIQWRDVEAVERLLAQPPRAWFWTPTASPSPELETRLAAAVQLADANRRLTALMAETAQPIQKYVVVRLVDLPHLAVAVYERLIGENG